MLDRIAQPLAQKNKICCEPYNPTKDWPDIAFNYIVILAPVPKVVIDSVKCSANKGIINIFAGRPADVTSPIDLNAYIEKNLYFIGTSGLTLADMRAVLAKVEEGRLNTNLSVAAVSGLGAAIEGIRAVENRSIPGKIVVYPTCKDWALATLDTLKEKLPDVADCLEDGLWNIMAEDILLRTYKRF